MQKDAANNNNKVIDWNYLPDEQLVDVVSKYPFYTKANIEVLRRSSDNTNQNLNLLRNKTALYITNYGLLKNNTVIDNNIEDDVSNRLEVNEKIVSNIDETIPPDASLNEKNSPENNLHEEPIIPVEPLHTVDYFLSQGIKVTDDTMSNDKLGTQLKSFTDWLKSMKKLHVQKLEPQSENTDKIIQSIAEHSNEAAGVETEAMAEVLIRQGKRLQALEIYQKLSLKNPAESAYFAAKIQSLKQA